jgi:hypothetical protein
MLVPDESDQAHGPALLHMISYCWRHPSLLGYEILWRWLFGIPAAWIICVQAVRLGTLVPSDLSSGLLSSAYNPPRASEFLAQIAILLWPTVQAILKWLLPLLAVGWILISSIGRWLVLHRLAKLRPGLITSIQLRRLRLPLFVFQALRLLSLAAVFALWWICINWAARVSIEANTTPNLVLYSAIVIISSLALFTAWALMSWVISVAPIICLHFRAGIGASLIRAVRLPRALTVQLIEMNLQLGIIKLALLVLAMVFSALPIPFEAEVPAQQLHWWWAAVAVWYLVANDFFQVARLVQMVKLVATPDESNVDARA